MVSILRRLRWVPSIHEHKQECSDITFYGRPRIKWCQLLRAKTYRVRHGCLMPDIMMIGWIRTSNQPRFLQKYNEVKKLFNALNRYLGTPIRLAFIDFHSGIAYDHIRIAFRCHPIPIDRDYFYRSRIRRINDHMTNFIERKIAYSNPLVTSLASLIATPKKGWKNVSRSFGSLPASASAFSGPSVMATLRRRCRYRASTSSPRFAPFLPTMIQKKPVILCDIEFSDDDSGSAQSSRCLRFFFIDHPLGVCNPSLARCEERISNSTLGGHLSVQETYRANHCFRPTMSI